MRQKCLRLWRRYNPRRCKIDVDEPTLILAAELGWVECYRGEWELTEYGTKELLNIVKGVENEYDSRSIN